MNKPIIHAYIRRKLSGDWELIISVGNQLPVHHATYYSRFEARQEANRLGASTCLVVAPEAVH